MSAGWFENKPDFHTFELACCLIWKTRNETFDLSAKRLIALQSVFYGFANGIEALVPFLLAPILTRSLDPTEYGLWVLFVTYSTFLRPIIGLTSQDAIRMRFYDFDQEQLDQVPVQPV